MKRDSSVLLKHILESIDTIESYLNNQTKENFLDSKLLQDAIMRKIEVIGEAVKSISEEFKNSYPDIPWKKIASMRDVLIHEYFNVDTQLVWTITQKELPVLKNQIMDILDKLKS